MMTHDVPVRNHPKDDYGLPIIMADSAIVAIVFLEPVEYSLGECGDGCSESDKRCGWIVGDVYFPEVDKVGNGFEDVEEG